MQASTASMCLRKLSDCVNSHIRFHASCRLIMVFPLVFSFYSPGFIGDHTAFVCIFPLTSRKRMIDTTPSCCISYLKKWSRAGSGSSERLNGDNLGPG